MSEQGWASVRCNPPLNAQCGRSNIGCGCLALAVCVFVCELMVLDKIPTFSNNFTQSGVTSVSYERLIDCLCCVVHSNTHCCVCHSYHSGHVRGCRSLSATDDILTGSRMVRLTAQQRAELVQLHLQGESIDAIVQQTGHARTTVLRWVRRFAVDGLLLDRPRSGRPLSVMTPTVVGRIRQLAKAKRGRRSRSTRQIAAVLSSRGTLISRTSVCQALHSKGVKPYVQPQVPLQRYGDKQRRLRFAAEQKERDWRCCVFADEKTFVCDPRPNRRNDVIWTDDPHQVLPTLSPSTPSVLSLHRANRLSSFFPRILLHHSTSRSLNPLCCQQREIGFLADTGPIYKIAIRSTLQN